MASKLAYRQKEDRDLVELFLQKSDLEALGVLYDRHISMVYGVCLKYLKHASNSQDAVMEIFELLVKRMPSKKIENFQAWLYRLTANHCLDILRKEKTTEKHISNFHSMQNETFIRPTVDEEDEKEWMMKAMEDCIEELNELQKVCVTMFYIKEKSYDEIANSQNLSWKQTRSHIQNGRRNLRNCMETKVS